MEYWGLKWVNPSSKAWTDLNIWNDDRTAFNTHSAYDNEL